MKRSLLIATALVALSGQAFAGGLNDPVVIAAPVELAPEVRAGGDWTGPYAGLQFGRIDVDGDGGADGDDVFFGGHFGYDYDFGQFVLGGEVDFDTMDVDLGGAADVDNAVRLKLRAGADLGRTLIYGTAGAVRIDTSLGEGDGYFGGLGVAYQFTPQFQLGAEYLSHQFDDIGDSGVDATANTLSLRATFRF